MSCFWAGESSLPDACPHEFSCCLSPSNDCTDRVLRVKTPVSWHPVQFASYRRLPSAVSPGTAAARALNAGQASDAAISMDSTARAATIDLHASDDFIFHLPRSAAGTAKRRLNGQPATAHARYGFHAILRRAIDGGNCSPSLNSPLATQVRPSSRTASRQDAESTCSLATLRGIQETR